MRAARPLATETYCSLPSTHYLLLTTYYSLRTYVVREDHRLELAQRLDGCPPGSGLGLGPVVSVAWPGAFRELCLTVRHARDLLLRSLRGALGLGLGFGLGVGLGLGLGLGLGVRVRAR